MTNGYLVIGTTTKSPVTSDGRVLTSNDFGPEGTNFSRVYTATDPDFLGNNTFEINPLDQKALELTLSTIWYSGQSSNGVPYFWNSAYQAGPNISQTLQNMATGNNVQQDERTKRNAVPRITARVQSFHKSTLGVTFAVYHHGRWLDSTSLHHHLEDLRGAPASLEVVAAAITVRRLGNGTWREWAEGLGRGRQGPAQGDYQRGPSRRCDCQNTYTCIFVIMQICCMFYHSLARDAPDDSFLAFALYLPFVFIGSPD